MHRLSGWILDVCDTFPDLTPFWGVGAQMQPFSEESTVGTETSVPHRSLTSPRNLWNKASHQGGKGNHEASRPAKAGAQPSEINGLSEPRPH